MLTPINQPQTITDIWSNAFRLTKASIGKTWYWLLLCYVVPVVLAIAAVILLGIIKPTVIAWIVAVPIFIIALFVCLAFYGTALLRVQQILVNDTGSASTAFKIALCKSPKFLITMIIALIILLVGYCALILPGIYFTVTFWLLASVIMFEAAGVFGSIKNSFNLVWGNWWRTLGVIIVPGFILNALMFLAGVIAGIIQAATHSPDHTVNPIIDIISILINYIFMFYLVPLIVVQYYDLKARKELKA